MTAHIPDDFYDTPHNIEHRIVDYGVREAGKEAFSASREPTHEELARHTEEQKKNQESREREKYIEELRAHRAGLDLFQFCEQCNTQIDPRKFARHERWHKEQDAGATRAYRCLYCRDLFATLGSVSRHTEEAHSALGKMCGRCGKTFFTRRELLAHFYENHANDAPVCARPECAVDGKPRVFADFFCLDRHNNEQHRAGKKRALTPSFECDKCDAKFVLESSLEEHRATHRGAKRCRACGEDVLAEQLESHTKLKHAAELVCVECDPPRSFTRPYWLAQHFRRGWHRSLVCRECSPPVKFESRSMKTRHAKKQHGAESN